MSAQQRLSQGGVGIFNQQGLMNGMLGNSNSGNMNNVGGLGAMNNMGGMANNMNLGNAGGNFSGLSAGGMNSNAASNFNNFNANDLMRLQLQQQQLQQQMQLQQMQMQGGGGLNNPNFALMAAQNQNQFGNNAPNNNFLQSLMGRNQVGGLAGQGNFQQNPFLGQLMMNQQQGALSQLGGGAGLAGNQGAGANSMFNRDANRRMRGGVIEPFPEKLHRLLIEVEACGRADVISFVANGRAFAIHKADVFFKEIVPLYFRQSRLSSFKRQLNLYGFELINTGPARGGYYHEMFVKERPELCRRMRRVAVKVNPKKKKGITGDSDEKDEKDEEVAADEAKTEDVPSSTEETAKDDSEEATKEEVKTEEATPADEAPVEKAEDKEEATEVTPKKEETEKEV